MGEISQFMLYRIQISDIIASLVGSVPSPFGVVGGRLHTLDDPLDAWTAHFLMVAELVHLESLGQFVRVLHVRRQIDHHLGAIQGG